MDVNQTRFHLLHGRADWGQLRLSDGTAALAELWQQPEGVDLPVVWDDTSRALRLTSRVPLFRRASGTEELVIAQRRGADRDSYGNWYWIDEAESGIRFLPSGGSPATEFWTSLRRDERCALPDDGDFAAKPAPAPEPLLLRGLAVTKAHYLVVGDVTRRGLLVFDLHSGDAPILLRWPAGVPFEPWDLAATSDGGLLVLDRTHATYWRLNDDFRLPGQPLPGETIWFQPKDGAAPARADLRDGFLVVAAPRNSVTAIIANTPMAAGEELAQRALVDVGADRVSLELRLVADEVLRRRSDALGLHAAYECRGDGPREQWILGVALEVPSRDR